MDSAFKQPTFDDKLYALVELGKVKLGIRKFIKFDCGDRVTVDKMYIGTVAGIAHGVNPMCDYLVNFDDSLGAYWIKERKLRLIAAVSKS